MSKQKGRVTRDKGQGGNTPPRSARHPSLKEGNKKLKERNFFEDVFDVVRLIPKGRVTNYGSIAKYLGTGMSSRMVGWAMNASHGAIPSVPAQRVVNRNGMLTGKHHFSTPTLMQELLEKEGVEVRNDKVLEFEKRFWDPARELAM